MMGKTVIDELIEASEEAVSAAEFVIRTCEADLHAGNSPSPFERSKPSPVMAECYAAMNFVGRLRGAIAKVKCNGDGASKEGRNRK